MRCSHNCQQCAYTASNAHVRLQVIEYLNISGLVIDFATSPVRTGNSFFDTERKTCSSFNIWQNASFVVYRLITTPQLECGHSNSSKLDHILLPQKIHDDTSIDRVDKPLHTLTNGNNIARMRGGKQGRSLESRKCRYSQFRTTSYTPKIITESDKNDTDNKLPRAVW